MRSLGQYVRNNMWYLWFMTVGIASVVVGTVGAWHGLWGGFVTCFLGGVWIGVASCVKES